MAQSCTEACLLCATEDKLIKKNKYINNWVILERPKYILGSDL